MDQSRQSKRYEKMRAMGRWRFIIVRGVLAWGLITAVLWSALMAFFAETSFLGNLLIAVPIFMLGGLIWGVWVWNGITKHQSNSEEEAPSDI